MTMDSSSPPWIEYYFTEPGAPFYEHLDSFHVVELINPNLGESLKEEKQQIGSPSFFAPTQKKTKPWLLEEKEFNALSDEDKEFSISTSELIKLLEQKKEDGTFTYPYLKYRFSLNFVQFALNTRKLTIELITQNANDRDWFYNNDSHKLLKSECINPDEYDKEVIKQIEEIHMTTPELKIKQYG